MASRHARRRGAGRWFAIACLQASHGVVQDRLWVWQSIGRFTRLPEKLDTDQFIAQRPQSNAKPENLNANIENELFKVENSFDVAAASCRLHAWVRGG